jgi:hypothetical protein
MFVELVIAVSDLQHARAYETNSGSQVTNTGRLEGTCPSGHHLLPALDPNAGSASWDNEFCVRDTEFRELLAQQELWPNGRA